MSIENHIVILATGKISDALSEYAITISGKQKLVQLLIESMSMFLWIELQKAIVLAKNVQSSDIKYK